MSKPTYRERGEASPTFVALKSVALKFVERINAGDSEGLMALQTQDFTFIDMAGAVIGRTTGSHVPPEV